LAKSERSRSTSWLERKLDLIDHFGLRHALTDSPHRLDDFYVGESEEIVVRLGRTYIEVRLFTLTWPHPHTPEPASRPFVKIRWSDLPEDLDMAREAIRLLIESARIVRKAEYRTCRFCRGLLPPEHMHDKDVCHGCAEQHLGVVH
jgi:hypothetical protein